MMIFHHVSTSLSRLTTGNQPRRAKIREMAELHWLSRVGYSYLLGFMTCLSKGGICLNGSTNECFYAFGFHARV
jgi:hypothetical protein